MKVGVMVRCAVCGDMKKPRGRSGPMGMSFCEPIWDGHGCAGYDQDPQAGSLWPGESDEDFGYPVGAHGWKLVEMGDETR